MKGFLKTTRFKVLCGVALVLVGFIVYSVTAGGAGNLPSSVIGIFTAPLQSFSASISRATEDFLGNFESVDELQKRVEELEEEARILRERQVEHDALLRENEELKQYLDIKERHPDYELLPAGVIARDVGEKAYAFTVDAGSLDGVALYDPVITADGLVGYVYEVALTYAKVRTLFDPQTEIGAIDSASQDSGVVGQGTWELTEKGLCRFSYLRKEHSVRTGDLVISSGIGGRYPQGLIIGTVQAVYEEPGGASAYAEIKPASAIQSVRDVVIITAFEGQGIGLPEGQQAGGAW